MEEVAQLARKTVQGNSSSSKEWGEGHLKGIQEELDYNRKYQPQEKQTHHGYTSRTLEVMVPFYEKLEELAARFKVSCDLEVPNWGQEEPHRALFGGTMSFGRDDSCVKCVFTITEDGAERTITCNVLLVPDDEDSFVGYQFLGETEEERDYPFKGPFLFLPRHDPYNSKDGYVYPDGWEDNDLKNVLAKIAFKEAFRQIPHPDDVP